ncbi:MAG: hypothetical protein WC661_11010 [Opitutaceae bacterium]|jgi:hypothetical protein
MNGINGTRLQAGSSLFSEGRKVERVVPNPLTRQSRAKIPGQRIGTMRSTLRFFRQAERHLTLLPIENSEGTSSRIKVPDRPILGAKGVSGSRTHGKRADLPQKKGLFVGFNLLAGSLNILSEEKNVLPVIQEQLSIGKKIKPATGNVLSCGKDVLLGKQNILAGEKKVLSTKKKHLIDRKHVLAAERNVLVARFEIKLGNKENRLNVERLIRGVDSNSVRPP